MKSQKKHILLEGLGALPSPEAETSDVPKDGDNLSPLAEPNPTLPLWRRVDKQYWWNEWMTKPFLDAGVCPHGMNKPSIVAHRSYSQLHCYVLPIMQGYFQLAKFNVPSDDAIADEPDIVVDYIIVSRRSRHRAGLRYQRRGIDDDAHVANFVETETIMRVEVCYQGSSLMNLSESGHFSARGKTIYLLTFKSGAQVRPSPSTGLTKTD